MTLSNKLCTMLPSFSKQQRLRFEHDFLAFTSPEAKSLQVQTVYKGLTELLGDKPTFFGDKSDQTLKVTSLDIVAYSYLKREIVNVPHVQYLKNFQSLIDFTTNLEARLNKKCAVNQESL